MKRGYRVLVLTDHSGHSDQNSIYAILNQMLVHPDCLSIHVVSRGLEINNGFFSEMDFNGVYGSKVENDFSYSENGTYYLKGMEKINPKDFDLVFLRLPRPISDEYLLYLEKIFNRSVIINRPSGIIETSNKKFLLHFEDLCPNIRLCTSIDQILQETSKFPIVIKPLKEYGGRGLLKINGSQLDDGTKFHHTETYLENIKSTIEEDGYLAMQFLKNVTQGDKRILVAGGEILASSLRLPKEGSWLCNIAQGGASRASDISEEEIRIINKINPILKQKGILIYGVDTLVNDYGIRVLSEINTLSIGGFPQAEKQTGKPIIKVLLDKIFSYAKERIG